MADGSFSFLHMKKLKGVAYSIFCGCSGLWAFFLKAACFNQDKCSEGKEEEKH
ncbi:hypothetical protein B4098_3031 [Heyndrickxia coagulans]|uniref:Uncharacterized protein n=1 Tax=Heyndrickxia coagulans TaxID=1398 RepID=A0A150KHQ4_HEYCO|nr:hypothetical protein B4098_3031 [Heyndrickxia coagulans]KYC71680.1 hypothetical protein B4099_3221 [Heyndrickxia coagulans]